jgi:hypothetical protein
MADKPKKKGQKEKRQAKSAEQHKKQEMKTPSSKK